MLVITTVYACSGHTAEILLPGTMSTWFPILEVQGVFRPYHGIVLTPKVVGWKTAAPRVLPELSNAQPFCVGKALTEEHELIISLT